MEIRWSPRLEQALSAWSGSRQGSLIGVRVSPVWIWTYDHMPRCWRLSEEEEAGYQQCPGRRNVSQSESRKAYPSWWFQHTEQL